MDTFRPTAIDPVSSRKTLLGRKRQHRSLALKRQIVEATLTPGASVARVARAHGVNANQVFGWRRLYRQGLLDNENGRTPALLPVHVVGEAARSGGARPRSTSRTLSGVIQIELPKGRLRLTGGVDVEALQVVLEKLLG
jgi:transposase